MSLFSPATDPRKVSVQARLANTPAVRRALTEARAAQAAYISVYDSHLLSLDPLEAKRALQSSLEAATDADGINAIQAALSAYTDPKDDSHTRARNRAAALISTAAQPLKKSVLALLQSSLDAFAEIEREAIKAETDLFSQFGMGREATAVYTRLAADAQKLRDFVASTTAPDPMRSNPCPPKRYLSHVVDWFAGQ
jgi:hypothetical protein